MLGRFEFCFTCRLLACELKLLLTTFVVVFFDREEYCLFVIEGRKREVLSVFFFVRVEEAVRV